jgi:hypothetical protein
MKDSISLKCSEQDGYTYHLLAKLTGKEDDDITANR